MAVTSAASRIAPTSSSVINSAHSTSSNALGGPSKVTDSASRVDSGTSAAIDEDELAQPNVAVRRTRRGSRTVGRSGEWITLRQATHGEAGWNRTVRTRVFDFRVDQPVEEPAIRVQAGAVLLFDGVLLLRPELEGCWDLSMFVQVDPEVSLQRASRRELELFGTSDATEQRYRERYLPGQELYLSLVAADQRADVLIDNNDPAGPRLLRMPPG